jgi:hypothetical protein
MTSMASITRPKREVPGLRDANVHRLERLAGELRRRGMAASLVSAPGRIPRLEVACPAGQGEDVYAWRGEDGTWWFWWSWAERIAGTADLDDASAKIEQVLTRPSWG